LFKKEKKNQSQFKVHDLKKTKNTTTKNPKPQHVLTTLRTSLFLNIYCIDTFQRGRQLLKNNLYYEWIQHMQN